MWPPQKMKLNMSFLPVNSVRNQFRSPMLKMQVVVSDYVIRPVYTNELDAKRSK